MVFTSLSYLAAVLPHLLSGRRLVQPGKFWMPQPVGLVVNALSCVYLMAFSIIFCFPSSLPVDASNMNYTLVIVTGWTLMATVWLFFNRKRNPSSASPSTPENEDLAEDEVVGPRLINTRENVQSAAKDSIRV